MKKPTFVEAVRQEGDAWALYPHPGYECGKGSAQDPLTQDTRDYHNMRARVHHRKNWSVSLRHRMLAGVSS